MVKKFLSIVSLCAVLMSSAMGVHAAEVGEPVISSLDGITVIPRAGYDEVQDPSGRLVQKYDFAGLYYIPGTEAADIATANMYAMRSFSGIFPAFGARAGMIMVNGDVVSADYDGDSVYTAIAVQNEADAWCAANLPGIVPSGTDQNTAATMIAQYIADHTLFRDPVSAGVPAFHAMGQTALPVLYENVGVCANYSAALNTMVHFLPVNPLTGLVDWDCTSGTYHIPVREITLADNLLHARSSVFIQDRWRVIDATWYDNTGNSRYLDY